MSSPSKKVSQAVAGEMIAVLGDTGAAKAIGTTAAGLKLLASGMKDLSDTALEQISASTGKTWRTWLLGAVKRAGASHQIITFTSELVNSLNQAESDVEKPRKTARRPRAVRVA